MLGISKTTVGAMASMARVAGVNWAAAQGLNGEELEARVYRPAVPRSSRHLHIGGEKLCVDDAGQTMPIVDAANGEVRRAQICVAVPPARPGRPRDKPKVEVGVQHLADKRRPCTLVAGVRSWLFSAFRALLREPAAGVSLATTSPARAAPPGR